MIVIGAQELYSFILLQRNFKNKSKPVTQLKCYHILENLKKILLDTSFK